MPENAPASERLSALACLALGMGIVGTSVTASKYLVGNIPIMLANGIRFLLASIMLLLIVRVLEHGLPRISRRMHLILAAQAFTGSFAFNILLLIGLDMTTAVVSGIITATTPAMIAIMSFALGDRLGSIAWFGILLAIAGVVLVNLLANPSEEVARRPILGAMLIVLAVVCEAAYTILGRMVARDVRPFSMATFICLYTTVLFLPLALWDLRDFDPGTVPASTWIAILYLTAVVTVISFALWFRGLAVIPASTAGAFTGMIPVTAVISAAILLDEPVGWPHITGIACVLAGILLVANARPAPLRQAPPVSV